MICPELDRTFKNGLQGSSDPILCFGWCNLGMPVLLLQLHQHWLRFSMWFYQDTESFSYELHCMASLILDPFTQKKEWLVLLFLCKFSLSRAVSQNDKALEVISKLSNRCSLPLLHKWGQSHSLDIEYEKKSQLHPSLIHFHSGYLFEKKVTCQNSCVVILILIIILNDQNLGAFVLGIIHFQSRLLQ